MLLFTVSYRVFAGLARGAPLELLDAGTEASPLASSGMRLAPKSKRMMSEHYDQLGLPHEPGPDITACVIHFP